MENRKPMRAASSQSVGKTVDLNTQLMDVIISRLEVVSEKGREKVLEFIQDVVDMEERQLEFDRRQGRLYNWPAEDPRV